MSFQIAIDGPAGAGKSTIAKAVARQLDFIYIDTGAMYRAMGLFLLKEGVDPESEEEVSAACTKAEITISYENGQQQVFVNGENVTGQIRTEEAGKVASKVSTYREVRRRLVALQQSLAESTDVVMDGRDIGTVVLPAAGLKVYLTASVEERARRRYLELKSRQAEADLKMIEEDIRKRDEQDMNRTESPLRQAEDAVYLDSSARSIDEVTAEILRLYKERATA